ncbi:MAG: hypothetical protein ACTSWU_00905 [Candidatus Thorarchaeota archaeon]
MSKTDLKEALSDINRMIHELTRDRLTAIAQENYHESKKLLRLQLDYMKDRESYRKQLSLMRRSKY